MSLHEPSVPLEAPGADPQAAPGTLNDLNAEELAQLHVEIQDAIEKSAPEMSSRMAPRPRPETESAELIGIVSRQIQAFLDTPTSLVPWSPATRHFVDHANATLWATEILNYTHPQIKSLLSQEQPPTSETFASQQWIDTLDFGVYGCMLTPEEDGHSSHLYVGSATGARGMHCRRVNRENPEYLKKEKRSFFHSLLQDKVQRRSGWVTILHIPNSQTESDPYQRTRYRLLCQLAEATYTTLFQAYHPPALNLLSILWKDQVDWHGLLSHVCLTEGLRLSVCHEISRLVSSFKSQVKYKRNKLEHEKLKETNPEEWEKLEKKKKAALVQRNKQRKLRRLEFKQNNPEEYRKKAKEGAEWARIHMDKKRKLALEPEEFEEFLRKRSERQQKKRNA
ncbi:hypothetical protein EDB80DRAFT_683689 [Ilyonectria destructans]|nr:hypothetical protein EDB80DRAFT_683689 [Ilyonectria destructans]